MGLWGEDIQRHVDDDGNSHRAILRSHGKLLHHDQCKTSHPFRLGAALADRIGARQVYPGFSAGQEELLESNKLAGLRADARNAMLGREQHANHPGDRMTGDIDNGHE